jgi:hypothetical protein
MNFQFGERINFTMKRRGMGTPRGTLRSHMDQLDTYGVKAQKITQREPDLSSKLSFSAHYRLFATTPLEYRTFLPHIGVL